LSEYRKEHVNTLCRQDNGDDTYSTQVLQSVKRENTFKAISLQACTRP